jgi:hypothetical protein
LWILQTFDDVIDFIIFLWILDKLAKVRLKTQGDGVLLNFFNVAI